MDLLGSIIGKMDSGPPRPKPTAAQLRARKMQEAQQKEEEKRREHYSNKIRRKMETIRKYVDEEQKRLAESEDPEVCERIEPLIKYNFHPMDAVWRKIVADIAEEFDLVAVALGPRDARNWSSDKKK
ncbi:Oidioi.mRNA.OKI2018_I69.XSR.g16086.t2.cds [Oikopleura dioica]|uniref:Oidioi.mRNA.OKI2018_I69.XSR.g16086.t2.cds n=1 Tax=Oikopleura dioica TaxID=34765 RepID=A0ABN7SEZ0_OIKDI|nr:Oidioi.mRNA.OKI2018_I69.XSR.g16086.t2.cds [Oikopleura dioica]